MKSEHKETERGDQKWLSVRLQSVIRVSISFASTLALIDLYKLEGSQLERKLPKRKPNNVFSPCRYECPTYNKGRISEIYNDCPIADTIEPNTN